MPGRKLEIRKGRGKLVSGGDNYELFMDGHVIAQGRFSEMQEQKKDIESQFPKDSAMDSMFTVDVEFKSGVCIKPQFLTQREAVAYAGRMAQDSAVKRSEVRGLDAEPFKGPYKGFSVGDLVKIREGGEGVIESLGDNGAVIKGRGYWNYGDLWKGNRPKAPGNYSEFGKK